MDNPSVIAAAAAAKAEDTKDKDPRERVEESLPEGIRKILSAYMRSLYADLSVVVGCGGQGPSTLYFLHDLPGLPDACMSACTIIFNIRSKRKGIRGERS